MIRVTVELLRGGDETNVRHLGTAYITNDAATTLATAGDFGAYDVKLSKWGNPNATWKKGRVEDFDRVKRGPWDLLFLALRDTVGSRNS